MKKPLGLGQPGRRIKTKLNANTFKSGTVAVRAAKGFRFGGSKLAARTAAFA